MRDPRGYPAVKTTQESKQSMSSISYRIHNATISKDSWDAALTAVNGFLGSRKAKNFNCYKSHWYGLKTFFQDVGFRIKEHPDCLEIVWVEQAQPYGLGYFLSILAPYLNPDSVFECLDIHRELHYRFVIRDKQLIIQSGKVVYEDEGTPVVY